MSKLHADGPPLASKPITSHPHGVEEKQKHGTVKEIAGFLRFFLLLNLYFLQCQSMTILYEFCPNMVKLQNIPGNFKSFRIYHNYICAGTVAFYK